MLKFFGFSTLLTLLLFIGSSVTVSAQGGSSDYQLLAPIPIGAGNNVQNSVPVTGFASYAQNLITLIIGISAVLAVLMIMFGGFMYMTGEALHAKSEGKSYMMNAVYGLVLLLASYLILYTINPQLLNLNLVIPGVGGGVTQGGGNPNPTVPQTPIPPRTGDCSPQAFQSAGVGIPANVATAFSCLAQYESACNLTADNSVSSAYGVLQILRGYDNTCHNLNFPVCTGAAEAAGYTVSGNLNCSTAFGSGGNVTPGKESLAAACDAAAANFSCNALAGYCLYQDSYNPQVPGSGCGPWEVRNKCSAECSL